MKNKASTTQTPLQAIRESFNNWVDLHLDTGKRDKEGNRIFKNVDTGQEQVFVDEEEAFPEE